MIREIMITVCLIWVISMSLVVHYVKTQSQAKDVELGQVRNEINVLASRLIECKMNLKRYDLGCFNTCSEMMLAHKRRLHNGLNADWMEK